MSFRKIRTARSGGWLAHDDGSSIPSNIECRTLGELIYRFRKQLVGCCVILVAMVFGYGWLISNPPYIIEIRERAPGGTVTYGWEESTSPFNNPQLDVLRQHTFSRIYHGVYYAGLTYHFSRSGRVFAIEGLETSGGYRMVRSWKWSGDPHKFPYYDFSHEWRKNQA